jgi:pre-mRNA-splicing factor SYF1
VWSMYVDLVEALGTFEEARAVYDEMLSLRVASAQVVLNYADFLQQRKFWEDAFRVYEKGVALFQFPHVQPIWEMYLTTFVDRHKGGKLERARDLFLQVCPSTRSSVPNSSPFSGCGTQYTESFVAPPPTTGKPLPAPS